MPNDPKGRKMAEAVDEYYRRTETEKHLAYRRAVKAAGPRR